MCKCACKLVLVIVNTVAGIAAGIIMIFGALLLWNRTTIISLLSKDIKPLLAATTNGEPDKYIDAMVDFLSAATRSLAMALFIGSAILAGICVLGCFGALCQVQLLLYLYIIAVSIIVVAHVSLLIVYGMKADSLVGVIMEQLENVMEKYVSMKSGTVESFIAGLVMSNNGCCGFKNGEDFKKSKHFSGQDEFSGQAIPKLEYPIVCCKMTNFMIQDKTCPEKFTKGNSNYHIGCEGVYKKVVRKYLDVIAFITIALLCVEILLIMLAIWTVCC